MSYLLITLTALTLFAFPINKVQANGLQDTYNPQQTLTAEQQEQEWSRQLVAYARTLEGKRLGHCVLGIRNYFGVSRKEVQGQAKNTVINSQTGKVGAIIVFKNMSRWGHVTYQITTPDQNGNITYIGFNEKGTPREIATGRGKAVIKTINISDKRISGYRII